jgi:zinc D-Ala-D-Ala carboxypeptidase
MKYFTINEFDSPDAIGSGENMDKEFLSRVDQARSIAQIPFKITSGFRTQQYNEDLLARGYKASANSSHMKGLAVDIACNDSSRRHKIITALMKAGLNRIGIADTFIHVDADTDKPANVIWTY